MKILQIFGGVAAAHVGLFLFLFAVPGCRSSGKSTATQPAVIDHAPAYPDERLSPMLVPTSPVLDDASLNPALAPVYSPSGQTSAGRYAPTRPGSTPVAAAPVAASPDVRTVSTYTVVKNDSLWGIAKKHGITVAELAAANNLSTKAGLRIGQKLIVPGGAADEPAAASASPAAAAPAAGRPYTVMPGDTLSGIAKKNGTTVAALRAANNLSGDMLRAGQSLIVPESAAPSAPAAAVTTTRRATSASTLGHMVKPGETLGAIARKYNVSVGELALANNITDPTRLRAGQEIKIPGWQAPPATGGTVAARPVVTPPPAPAPAANSLVPQPVRPEPVLPESLVPAPLDSSNDFVVPTEVPSEPELVPVVPVEESGALRVN